MKKLLIKYLLLLLIIYFFFLPRQQVFAGNFAAVTVGVSSPGGTPIANVKLDFTTNSTATYTNTAGTITRQCSSEAFVNLSPSPDVYMSKFSFTTGSDGKVTWDGISDYGFSCTCNDMRVVINLPEGYVVAGLYDGADNPLVYYGGTAAGGTASTFVTTSNNTRSSIYWSVKPQPVPPTTSSVPPTTSSVPPTCSSPCTRDQDCVNRNGCPYCDISTNTCTVSPPVTNPPSTTTTTAPFNPASCKCDSITYSGLFSGQNVTITSFSKIVGVDIASAKVVSEKFHLYNVTDPTKAKMIEESGDIPSKLIEKSPTLVRYQTEWQFTLPKLETGATYRIWSDINCQPKTIVFNYNKSPKTVVLGTENKASFLDNFFGFFNNLLNFFRNSSKKDNTVNSVAAPSTTSSSGKNSLQLEVLKQASGTSKGCYTIIFRQN